MSRPEHPDRFAYERTLLVRGHRRIAGVDEAGRGPLAGPVVAAAVSFPADWIERGLPAELRGLNDSKQLTARQRDAFFASLLADGRVLCAVAVVEVAVIDTLNILRASHQAMAEAIGRLPQTPDHLLVDGLPVPSLAGPQTAVVKGDSLSFSIAAASVLAKVTRDRLMLEHDRRWPEYGFARHKGYPTPEHLAALTRHGPCPIHRRSFAPVRVRQTELFG